jgi:hypothetical protein
MGEARNTSIVEEGMFWRKVTWKLEEENNINLYHLRAPGLMQPFKVGMG